MLAVTVAVMLIAVAIGIRATRSANGGAVGCCAPSDPRLDARMRSAYDADVPSTSAVD